MSGSKPRIFVAYTGGTIGMEKTASGYRPKPDYLQALMADLRQFQDPRVPHYDIFQFDPLLDSSNMTPADWIKIANVIRQNYHTYDGFLVLHGTDTMSFTASALSFMLEDLTKPVIVTGSQIPLAEIRNDALENLLTSLLILGKYHHRLCNVFLYFDNRLFRGNRTTKVDTDAYAAFESPNFPPVGTVGIDIDIDWQRLRPCPTSNATVSVVEIGEATIAAFRLFPGIQARYLHNILAPPVQGVVLECFGAGNAPDKNKPFMDVLKAATERGVVIVDVPQPLRGTANLELYATGQSLLDVGVVSGYDMTIEAALTKLFYLFAKGYSSEEIKQLVQTDLRGELTRPNEI